MSDQPAHSEHPDWQIEDQVGDIVARALELEGVQRVEFVDLACGDNLKLKDDVLSLLAVHDEDTNTFLSEPAALAFSGRAGARDVPADSAIPERIGPYEILELLGQGGMGTVYLAEQSHPVKRRVALKVIRSLSRGRAGERFASECQALAQLNHPNIAAMYETGLAQSNDGQQRAYVAMEWVDGEPINLWCDKRKLTVEWRLYLFFGVCAAISHAHSKGILHCDLKPNNVLVTEVDGRPIAKVIDFGIARALDEPQLESVEQAAGELMGSPQYLSPEAAGPEGRRNLDTRSDVHSLGLLLHQLVCGLLPFKVKGKNLWQHFQTIATCDPGLPSKLLEQAEPSLIQVIADQRNTRSSQLIKLLRGDLEAVVLKAIARQPDARYQSARALAEDLRHYLKKEPITARPQTRIYLLRRFIQRHKGMAVSMSLIALALFGGLFGRTLEAQRATAEAARANLEAERARVALSESEQVRNFLVELFQGADPERLGGDLTIQDVLEESAGRLDEDLGDQPVVKALLLQTIGEIYNKLGNLEKAQQSIGEALGLRRQELPPGHAAIVASEAELGIILRKLGHNEEAIQLLQSVLDARQRDPESTPELIASSLNNLGNAYWDNEQFDQALAAHRRALVIREENETPPDLLASSANNLGVMLLAQHRYQEARPRLQQATELYQQSFGRNHPHVASTLNNLGIVERNLRSWQQAEQLFRDAVEIWENHYGPEHRRTLQGRRNLAFELIATHRWQEALKEAQQSFSIMEQQPDPRRHGELLRLLALVHQRSGDSKQAAEYAEQALTLSEQHFGRENSRTIQIITTLAWNLGNLGETKTALELLREVSSQQTDLPEEHISRIRTVRAFGKVLFDAGRYTDAEQYYRELVKLRVSTNGQNHRDTAEGLYRLGLSLAAQNRHADATEAFEQSNQAYLSTVGPEHPAVAENMIELAKLELARENKEGAARLLKQAIEIWEGVYPAEDADLLSAREMLESL